MKYKSLITAATVVAASSLLLRAAPAWDPPEDLRIEESPVETAAGNSEGSGVLVPSSNAAAAGVIYHPAPQTATCDCPPACTKKMGWWARYKARKQEKYWGYPEEFEELPLGYLSTEIMCGQIRRGEKARLTLYDYDFMTGTAVLNARGQQRVAQLALLAMQRGESLTIQSVDANLDAARYQSVVDAANRACGLDPSQVVVGQPIAGGLNGEEALIHRETQLENASQSGVRQFNFGAASSSGFGISSGGNNAQ